MTSKSDLFAQSKGFRNYYQYRNYLAQLEGYRNYSEKRKAVAAARAAGVEAVPPVRRQVDTTTTATPELAGVQGKARALTVPHPRLDLIQQKISIDRDALLSGRSGKKFKPMRRWADRDIAKLREDAERLYGDPSQARNSVRKIYLMARKDAGGDGVIPGEDLSFIEEMASQTRSRYLEAANYLERDIRRWDSRAEGLTNRKEIRRHARKSISAWRNSLGNEYRPDKYEKGLLADLTTKVWNQATISASKTGWVYISDGKGCGLTEHDDPVKADGMIMTAEEAKRYPSAHPYCARAFYATQPPGPEVEEEMKKRLRQAEGAKDLSKDIKKAATATALAAALVGIASTEVTTATFQGTLGSFALNSLGPLLRNAMVAVEQLQARILSILQINPEYRGISVRLKEAGMALRQENPDLLQDQAERLIADAVWNKKNLWEAVGEEAVMDTATQRLIGVKIAESLDAGQVRKIVGDGWQNFDEYYRLRFFNSTQTTGITDLMSGIKITDTVASLGEELAHTALDFASPLNSKFGRLSFPRINLLEGDVRRTRRFGRVTMNPHDMVHIHSTFRPDTDGSWRFIQNLRLNPNGLMRLGFVRDADGLIRPNISLVPKGPIRVYSTVNRSKKFKTIVVDGVKKEIENPIAGRVNSVTTEVRLLTRWIPGMENWDAKMNVKLRALEIYSPRDILKIDQYKLRRLFYQEDQVFNFVSSGVKFRLNFGGLFEAERSLRVDEDGIWAIRAGIRNLDQQFRLLMSHYRDTINLAKNLEAAGLVNPTLLDQADMMVQAHLQFIRDIRNLDGPAHRAAVQRMKDQLGYKFREVGPPPDKWATWDMARWLFDAAQKEIQTRVDNLTDYLIAFQRPGVKPTVSEAVGQRFFLSDPSDRHAVRQVFIDSTDDAIEELMLQKPNLIMAVIESNPAAIARDLGMKITDWEANRERLLNVATRLFDGHLSFIPEAQRTAILERLASGEARRGWLRVVHPDSQDGENVENLAGVLRWHARADDVFKPNQAHLGVEGLQDRLLPGQSIDSRRLGRPVLHGQYESSVLAAVEPDHSGDLVEFIIDGASTQRIVNGELRLAGKYQVTNYYRESDPDYFPIGTPDDVTTLHRIYLRQTTSPRPELNSLGVTVNEMPQYGFDDHINRWIQLQKAYPDYVTAVDDAIHTGLDRLAPAMGTPGPHGHRVRMLQDLVEDAPVVGGKLYREISTTAAKALLNEGDSIIRQGTLFTDPLGLWGATRPEGSGDRVVLIANRVKALNVSPMSRSSFTRSDFLVSGQFKVNAVRTVITEEGETTYVILDFVKTLRS